MSGARIVTLVDGPGGLEYAHPHRIRRGNDRKPDQGRELSASFQDGLASAEVRARTKCKNADNSRPWSGAVVPAADRWG